MCACLYGLGHKARPLFQGLKTVPLKVSVLVHMTLSYMQATPSYVFCFVFCFPGVKLSSDTSERKASGTHGSSVHIYASSIIY